MLAILQTTFLMEIIVFLFEFNWNMFPGIQITNMPALVKIIAWRRTATKPLSEPVVA